MLFKFLKLFSYANCLFRRLIIFKNTLFSVLFYLYSCFHSLVIDFVAATPSPAREN